MANLSRAEMCDDAKLNINTLKGWELGKHGGLTENGAKKIVMRLARNFVNCSFGWLMSGIGPPPTLMQEKKSLFASAENELSEEFFIQNELFCFTTSCANKQINFLKVSDAAMLPTFAPNDYVAGIKYFDQHMEYLLGMSGIVELNNNISLLRKLVKNSKTKLYNLVPINPIYLEDNGIILDVNVSSFTPILWHRKPEVFIPSQQDQY